MKNILFYATAALGLAISSGAIAAQSPHRTNAVIAQMADGDGGATTHGHVHPQFADGEGGATTHSDLHPQFASWQS